MNKEILNKFKEQAKKVKVVGYDFSTEPATPIKKEVFDAEMFAELILNEAIYIGAGFVHDINPEHQGIITVHETATWQAKMTTHFLKDD